MPDFFARHDSRKGKEIADSFIVTGIYEDLKMLPITACMLYPYTSKMMLAICQKQHVSTHTFRSC